MKLDRRTILTGAAACLLLRGRPAPASSAAKVLYYGWSSPDTQQVRNGWAEMEDLPLDGIGILIAIQRDAWTQGARSTENQLGWQVMGRRAFRFEEFDAAVDDLRAPAWRRFQHNFLPWILSPGLSAEGLSWMDDARWQVIAGNASVLARIAAVTGTRGILLDPEHYGYRLFSYQDQRKSADVPFPEMAEAARRRGRQVMSAVASWLRDPVILSLLAYTLPLSLIRDGRRLELTEYALLPAFLDGLLDVLPPGAVLHDGYEFSYGFKRRWHFVAGRQRVLQDAMSLSAVPERYRQHVRTGFGLMLDYQDRPDYFTPAELQRSLEYALELSDGYVWLYSQRVGLFPPAGPMRAYLPVIADAKRRAGQTR
jgi:hypothetical protein